MRAVSRRIGKLEAATPAGRPCSRDPVTSELVTLDELYNYATEQELSVAEACLEADFQKATEPRWGCFEPDVGARICELPQEKRFEIVTLLQNRCHDRKTKRREMPPGELRGIEVDGLEWLLSGLRPPLESARS